MVKHLKNQEDTNKAAEKLDMFKKAVCRKGCKHV
jgi:hypothetical protein